MHPAVLSAQRHSTSLLLATPPGVRAEIVRRALLSRPPALPAHHRCVSFDDRSQATHGHSHYHQGSSILTTTKRRHIHLSHRLSADVTSTSSAEQQSTAYQQPSSAPSNPNTAPYRRPWRQALTAFSVLIVCFSSGLIMSAAPAADTVNGFLNPPSDAETLTLFEPQTPAAAEINEHIITHPLAIKLRAQEGMVESRPHLKIPVAMRPHNLTGGTLLGTDKIEVPPLSFSERDVALPTLVQFCYLGPALCGHPSIVHGGLLATLLDEGLARACFPALPNKVGVTASLKIDYRVPCPANSYVVLKAQTTKVEGRKAWVKGWIELLGEGDGEGVKLVEAEALYIEPKGAQGMARVYSSQ